MGAGGARGEGGGRDKVDAIFGAGAIISVFLVFMWIIGIPVLSSAIGMVATGEGLVFSITLRFTILKMDQQISMDVCPEIHQMSWKTFLQYQCTCAHFLQPARPI